MGNINRGSITVLGCAALAACLVLAGYGRALGQANNAVQTMIPAFYQHQGDNGGKPGKPGPTSATPSLASAIWKPDGGYCALVSDLDALYPWEVLNIGGYQPFDNVTVALFGAPGGGVGGKLTTAGMWLDAADDTVIPSLVPAAWGVGGTGPGSMSDYLLQQKVDPSNRGLLGLVDTTYRTLNAADAGKWNALPGGPPGGRMVNAGQVQFWANGSWMNLPAATTTFQEYQQLTSTGGTLPAALQPLAAITTTLTLDYAGANNSATTGFWWGYHQVAGAGVAAGNLIQYSDPDAIPVNAQANGVAVAASHNGGFFGNGVPLATGQTAVNNNEYNSAAYPTQKAGPVPLPGNQFVNGANNVNYTTTNLYGTMQLDPLGQVIAGGNSPYAAALPTGVGAVQPVARIANMDAFSLPAAQLVNSVVGPLFTATKFLFSGNFGGDISKLEIFPNSNSPLDDADLGLSDNDPDWGISQVMTDPYGNSWADTDGGIMLTEDAGGSDLMEDGTDYDFTENTMAPVTGWTVFAYDQADGYWLTESYDAGDVGDEPQQGDQVPEPSAFLLVSGLLVPVLLKRRRSLAGV